MAITMWYRGIHFVKDYFVRYLNYVFLANQKGRIQFTDGTREIKFSQTPEAIKRASWEYRVLPAVLIGKVTGGLQYVSFTKDLLRAPANAADPDQTYADGGDFDINLQLAVRATTVEERDNLADIVGIYLAHPDAKDYFMRHSIQLPEAPKLTGENDTPEPKIDFPIYETTMSIRVLSRWQETRPIESRLLSILVELETYYDLDSTGRITVIT